MRKNVLQGTVGVSAAVGNSTKTLQNDDCRKTCLLLAVTNKTKTLWRLSEFSKQDDRLDKERETYTKKLEMKNSLREKVNCEKILKDIESGTIVVGHKSESEVACNHVSSSKAMADDQQSVPEDDQKPVASSRSMVGDPENETRSTAKPKINQNSQPEDCYARKPTASPIIEINDEDNISKEGNIETRYLLDYHDSVVEVIEKPYSSRVDKDYTSRTNSRRDAIFKLKEKQLQDECDRKHLPKEIPIKKGHYGNLKGKAPVQATGTSNKVHEHHFEEILQMVDKAEFKQCSNVLTMHVSGENKMCIFKYGVMIFGCEHKTYRDAENMAQHVLFHLARIFKPPVSLELECPYKCGAKLKTAVEMEFHLANRCHTTDKWWRYHHTVFPMVHLVTEAVLNCLQQTNVKQKVDLLDPREITYPCGGCPKHPFAGGSIELSAEKRTMRSKGLIGLRVFKKKSRESSRIKPEHRRPKTLKRSLPDILLMSFLKRESDIEWTNAIDHFLPETLSLDDAIRK
jgi:hypothetical protein